MAMFVIHTMDYLKKLIVNFEFGKGANYEKSNKDTDNCYFC